MSDSSSDDDFLGATSLKLLRRFTTTTEDAQPRRAPQQPASASAQNVSTESRYCDSPVASLFAPIMMMSRPAPGQSTAGLSLCLCEAVALLDPPSLVWHFHDVLYRHNTSCCGFSIVALLYLVRRTPCVTPGNTIKHEPAGMLPGVQMITIHPATAQICISHALGLACMSLA